MMTRFSTARLADIAEVKGGKRLPANANLVSTPTSHPYIRGRDIRNGKITFDDPVYVLDEDFEKIQRYTVDSGDVCITIVGNIGDVGITPPHLHRASLTENAVKLVNLRHDFDALCLTYALLTPDAQSQMKHSAAGAAQPKLGIYEVNEIKVPAPPLPIQRRIAGILSAYDELIENSQRRIRILESMARSLYREWFVHFRFPGHETHPRVTSPLGDIPKGWEVRQLKDVANVTYGFPFQSKKFNTDGRGTPVIRIRDIVDGSINTFTDEEAEPKYHIKNGDILVGMDGDFHMCIWSSGHAFQNQRVAKIESRGEIGNFHLFLALELPIQTWNKSIVGTTVAHLGDMHIKTIQIAWPPAKLLAEARAILEPMSEQSIALKRQIQNLRRTRDLLLPHLLSGRVNLKEN